MDDDSNKSEQTSVTEPAKEVSEHDQKFLDIKSKAMDALVPILGTLEDVDPQKKFDLAIAAFRVSDSTELLEKALDFATSISDSSQKADALIDIINEANVQLSLTNS